MSAAAATADAREDGDALTAHLKKKFGQYGRKGRLDLAHFRRLWSNCFGPDLELDGPKNQELARRLFTVFDANGDGALDWNELRTGVNPVCSDNINERLMFGWVIYDYEKAGYITRDSALTTLGLVTDALYEDSPRNDTIVVMLVDLMFSNFNKGQDGKLTFTEFKDVAYSSPDAAKLLTLGVEVHALSSVTSPRGTGAGSGGSGKGKKARPMSVRVEAPDRQQLEAQLKRMSTVGDDPTSSVLSRATSYTSPQDSDDDTPPAGASGDLAADIALLRGQLEETRLQLAEEREQRARLEEDNKALREENERLQGKVSKKTAKRDRLSRSQSSASVSEALRQPDTTAPVTPIPPESEPTVLRSGWLMKRGKTNKKFKRRYFVLLATNVLRYGKTQSEDTTCGTIDLKTATAVHHSIDADAPGYAIDIITPDRMWTLCCDARDSYNEWLNTLKARIKMTS